MKYLFLTLFGVCMLLQSDLYAQQYHTVKPNQTLYSISTEYDLSVRELKSLNNLSNNEIHVGQRLLVARSQEDDIGSGEGSGLESRSPVTHTVKSGQSLFGISRTYDVDVSQIKELNNLTEDVINVGQQLIISLPDSKEIVGADASSEELSLGNYKRVTIPRGFSLSVFLRKHHMEEDELELINPDIDIEALVSGQTINVLQSPPDYDSEREEFFIKKPGTDENQKVTVDELQGINQPGLKGGESAGEDGQILPVFAYSESEKAAVTSSGELLNPEDRTIAHAKLPLGSIVLLENRSNGLTTIARVNDRITEQAVKVTPLIIRELKYSKMEQHQVTITQVKP